MSSEGRPDAAVDPAAAHDLKVAIVAGRWHATVAEGLVAGAVRGTREAGVVAPPTVVWVPGTFELAVVALHLARSGFDAVVALGVVIRGGTPHFDYVCAAATDGLGRVALDTGVPVGFGVLTCDDDQQALDRAGLPGSKEDKGFEAAQAAVATAALLRSLPARG